MKGREWRDFCGSQWDFWTANRVQNFITDCKLWQSLEFPVCTDTMKVNGYFGNKFPCRENGNFGDYSHGRFCDSFTHFFFSFLEFKWKWASRHQKCQRTMQVVIDLCSSRWVPWTSSVRIFWYLCGNAESQPLPSQICMWKGFPDHLNI